MNNQLKPLIIAIIAIAVYAGALVWAGLASLSNPTDKPPELPVILTQIVTVIGAALATDAIGISQFTGGNPRPIPKFWDISTWARLPSRGKKVNIDFANNRELQQMLISSSSGKLDFDKITVLQQEEPTQKRLQILYRCAAAYVYVISLSLAFIFWLITGFEANVADVIRNLSYSLVGVAAGVVSVILNVKKQ